MTVEGGALAVGMGAASGAIGGAIISTVSHAVNCAVNGQEITTSGLLNAAVTGAIGGAIGTATAIGIKAVGSIVVGKAIGVKSGIESSGTTGQRILTGISTGVISVGATFAGANIDASGAGFAGTAFANYATTLFVGTPAEVVSVFSQQAISKTGNKYRTTRKHTTTSRYSVSSRSRKITRRISVNYPNYKTGRQMNEFSDVVFFLLGWAFFSRYLAKYHFTEQGIEVVWPLRCQQLILWEEFQQVCVCFAEHSIRGEPRARMVYVV